MPIVELSRASASKPRICAALAGKRVLHLATHGYFATPQFASGPGPRGATMSGIRDPAALANRPDDEQKSGHSLWAEVDALEKKALGDRPRP